MCPNRNLGDGSSIQRYYDILPSNNTALNAKLRFKYFDAELNGYDENTMALWKSSDMINWSKQGFTYRDATNNYVEKTGIADFSRWTLSTSFMSKLVGGTNPKTPLSPSATKTNEHWAAWPNPVATTVWITITVDKDTKATTRIYDSKGDLISTRQDNVVAGKNILTIDVRDLPAGNYYIIAEWDNGKARPSARFVKL
jgi:hypothetical protein